MSNFSLSCFSVLGHCSSFSLQFISFCSAVCLSIFFGDLPTLFFPAILTSNISMANLSSIILWTCPSKLSCLSSTTFSIGTIFSSSTTIVFLILSLLVIPFILLRNLISIALTLLSFLSFSVHDSLPYISDNLTAFCKRTKKGRFEHIKQSSHFSCSLWYSLVYFTIVFY